MEIYVIGAGTLGRLVVDIVESHNQFRIAGFFDDGYPELKSVYGYKVVGKIDNMETRRVRNLAIGLGEPKLRKLFFENRSALGYKIPKLVHHSAVLSKHCLIEDGVIIGPNSSVLSGSTIKKGSCILSHVNINQDVTVGPYCLVGAGAVVGNNARIGEGCHIGLAAHIELNQVVEPWSYINDYFK